MGSFLPEYILSGDTVLVCAEEEISCVLKSNSSSTEEFIEAESVAWAGERDAVVVYGWFLEDSMCISPCAVTLTVLPCLALL